jgi:hypothetical protein
LSLLVIFPSAPSPSPLIFRRWSFRLFPPSHGLLPRAHVVLDRHRIYRIDLTARLRRTILRRWSPSRDGTTVTTEAMLVAPPAANGMRSEHSGRCVRLTRKEFATGASLTLTSSSSWGGAGMAGAHFDEELLLRATVAARGATSIRGVVSSSALAT